MIIRLLSRHRLHLAGAFLALSGLALLAVVASFPPDAPADADDADVPEVTEPEPVAAPTFTPDPLPEPEPAPDPQPVVGEIELTGVVELSTSGVGLFQPGTPRDQAVPYDEEAVDAFVDAIADWIDAAITATNLGGDAAADTAGLTGPAELVLLGDPGSPTTGAHYAVTVGALGEPEWAEVLVTATRGDGTQTFARLAFASQQGAATLLAAGPAEDVAQDRADDGTPEEQA